MKKEELGELIIASEDMMYHVAKTLLYRDADCADAIQETIVKAFSKLHTLKSDVYAKTWLTRILINECYTVMRKEKKVVSLEDYQMEERAAETKDYSELYEAISRLSEDARLSVTLYYMEGYSVREIAGILGVTESAVKNRLSRARAKLKNELEQENATEHAGHDRKRSGKTGKSDTAERLFFPEKSGSGVTGGNVCTWNDDFCGYKIISHEQQSAG